MAVLSGGERRRLDFAMAIWGEPDLIVLDEPTTGLDPQSRRTMWEIIRELNTNGSTVLLTTHYLEEAQSLAEHVTILNRGRVAIAGLMSEVLASLPSRISFSVHTGSAEISELERLLHGELKESRSHGEIAITIRTPLLQSDVGVVIDWSRAHNLVIGQLCCAPASLEEVFFDLSTADAPGMRKAE